MAVIGHHHCQPIINVCRALCHARRIIGDMQLNTMLISYALMQVSHGLQLQSLWIIPTAAFVRAHAGSHGCDTVMLLPSCFWHQPCVFNRRVVPSAETLQELPHHPPIEHTHRSDGLPVLTQCAAQLSSLARIKRSLMMISGPCNRLAELINALEHLKEHLKADTSHTAGGGGGTPVAACPTPDPPRTPGVRNKHPGAESIVFDSVDITTPSGVALVEGLDLVLGPGKR